MLVMIRNPPVSAAPLIRSYYCTQYYSDTNQMTSNEQSGTLFEGRLERRNKDSFADPWSFAELREQGLKGGTTYTRRLWMSNQGDNIAVWSCFTAKPLSDSGFP